MEQSVADKLFLFSFMGCIFLLETFSRAHFLERNLKMMYVSLFAGAKAVGEVLLFAFN
jgi:hypothetical protein